MSRTAKPPRQIWFEQRAAAMPLLVATVLFAIVGPTVLAGVIFILIVAAVAIGPRVASGRVAQVLFLLPTFLLLLVFISAAFPQPAGAILQLRTPWRAFGGAVLLVGTLRLFFARPMGGATATIGLALMALTACGGVNRGLLYPFFVLLFLVSAILGRRYSDPGHGPLTGLLRHRAWALASIVVVTAVVAGGLIEGIPRAHEWAVRQVMQRVSVRTGFSDRLDLGDLRGLLTSDERILRVRGKPPPLLRGVVYNSYKFGRWSHPERLRSINPPKLPTSSDVVEIENIEEEPKRYFLPYGASDVSVSTGYALVDRLGVLVPVAAEPATRIWYRPSGEPSYPVDPPAPQDLRMPVSVFYALKPYAEAWTRDATNTTEQLRALQARLVSRHAYSLDNDVPFGVDPVITFIRKKRSGHCEHFASSFALLARTIGIPTRVVGGYRVVEYNPVGGYALVRERDAHAWVEAWNGERWVTYDPTPASAALADRGRTPLFAALADAAGSVWLAFLDWLDRRTPEEMLVPPSLLILLFLAIRSWRRRSQTTEVKQEGPLPCFDELTETLSTAGIVRRPGETPLQWAARILDEKRLPAEQAEGAAELLTRYAALRYGGLGQEDDLGRDISAFREQLAR